MQLVARTAERGVEERCPYCHDALTAQASLPSEDLVACPGCATSHHRSCVEELGRCTIRGCERPLTAAPEADLVAGRARRASVTEEVRRRLRERARRFVSDHTTSPRQFAPVYETPAPAPQLRLEGKSPDLAKAQQFAAELAAHPAPRLDVAALVRQTADDAAVAKGLVRAELYRRAAELLRSPEGQAEPAAAVHAAEYEQLAAQGEQRTERGRRRRLLAILVLNAVLVVAIAGGLAYVLALLGAPP